jgi:hypothetical protein
MDSDAGVSRAREILPPQVKQMMDAWGRDDSSDGSKDQHESSNRSDWNDNYLSPAKSDNQRYIKSLEKGRHHYLRYTRSTSPDNTPDQTYQYQHRRVSGYHSDIKRNSSESLQSASSTNSHDDNSHMTLFELAKNWQSSFLPERKTALFGTRTTGRRPETKKHFMRII